MFAIKRVLLCVVLCVCFGGLAWTQSNDRVDQLLAQQQADWQSVSYIVLSANAIVDENVSPEDAFSKLGELAWFGKLPDAATPISIQDFSYMVMKALDLKGGVMYSIAPGPRYAYRELVYEKAINNPKGPEQLISGADVMRILAAALDRKAAKK